MSITRTDDRTTLYRWAVWLLLVASLGAMLARIASVRAHTGETPMLSANDRSRWGTIRALVEDGTYVIDRLVSIKHPETGRRYWKSIDMVRHRGPDGKEHYFSSKPPLLPTLLAGEYWIIRNVFGATLGDQPFLVMRLMLVISNVLPLLLFFILLWRLIERMTSDHLTLVYTMAAATWGTFLTTFAVTINNHLVAAIAVLLTVVLTVSIWFGERSWWYFAGAGLFSAFAAANELPALSFLACIGMGLMWKSPRQTLLAFLPGVLLVAAGFFGTNYIAHGTIVPAYLHRGDGPMVTTVSRDLDEALDQRELVDRVRDAMKESGIELSDQALVLVYQPGERWGIWDRVGHKRFALVAEGKLIEIRHWDNWYDYRGSYWISDRQGVDRGEPCRWVYAFHVLVGHRGVFSLTPIWLLSVAGAYLLLRQRRTGWTPFAAMVILLTIVCLGFYIARPRIDRNYGGVCCGFRWMFWFTPLWLFCLVPAAERLLRSRTGRLIALLLLLVSVFSATYAASDPWSHSWLFDFGTYVGWWNYTAGSS
ncbi:MAG: hypothetical protein ACQESR_13470 [Planctomycetota bacterium]